MPTLTLDSHTYTWADVRYRDTVQAPNATQRQARQSQQTQWQPIVSIAAKIVADRLEMWEEIEWQARLRKPSPQLDVLRRIINQGRKEYASGDAEEIVGDTFA